MSVVVQVSALCLSVGCVECPLVPGLSSQACGQLNTFQLPTELPPSPGNRVANDERAALLGFELFFDARLSGDGNVRCATCHVPEKMFADFEKTSKGLESVDRNSPSLYGAAWHRWQLWDGRADSLWSQPLFAFENVKEMDFTRLEIAHRVETTYRARYEQLFGALPQLSDLSRFPARGRPGLPSFDSMSAADQRAVNLIAANVGKAIEAYERRLAYGRSRFDAFIAGDSKSLTSAENEGLRVFVSKGCSECHSTGLFSDDAFHAIGWVDEPPRARKEALAVLKASVFSAAGEFHDGERQMLPEATAEDVGAYRTPSLRNVTRTGPWGHDGRFAAVGEAVSGHQQPGAPALTAPELDSLIKFLGALDAKAPPLPWNGWPDR